MDEYGRFDLKECADALSEVINKTMEDVKQPKFSTLNGDRNLMVYTGGDPAYTLDYTAEVMSKDDLLAAIQNGEVDKHGIVVYLAEKIVAQFREDDIWDMVQSVMEYSEQYEDWDEVMMDDIRDSAETKAFLQYLNARAEAHTTYDAGLRVEMDWEDKGRV